jgi:nicotinamide-nucleotide amidase
MSDLISKLSLKLTYMKWMLSTAESCTGGMIASHCTDLAGSSAWFERGFVCYSNDAKTQMLGVDPLLIDTHGAVSEPVARAMAIGAIYHSKASVAIAVTGVAGPSGGSLEKPVGTVWIAWCVNGHISTQINYFDGNRSQVRNATMAYALKGLIDRIPTQNVTKI